MYKSKSIGVVIPTYKSSNKIANVIEGIPKFVDLIVVVDDDCPEKSGHLALRTSKRKKIALISHSENQGVGGAMISGYEYCLQKDIDIIVKLDSDDQMDPAFMAELIHPIYLGNVDYSKGNRFFAIDSLKGMPVMRILGNSVLSLLTKISTGYWNIFDPTNGYTAISGATLRKLNLQKLSRRFFFESDILFRLNTIKAVVIDVDIPARYSDEKSNLKILRIIPEFTYLHLRNAIKRFVYNYILRDVSLASLELPIGIALLLIGSVRGISTWYKSWHNLQLASPGNVVLTSMLILTGIQFTLAFIAYDISAVPKNKF